MATIQDGIVIGSAGGAIAGLTVWFIQYAHDKVINHLESKRIYTWLNENTENIKGNQFRSTRAISSWTNLTEDKVRYLCSVDNRIFLSTGENEDIWSVYVHDRKANVHIG